MVTGYEDLPAMRKAAQPLVKVENGRSAFAEHREVARVDQDVSSGHVKFAVQLVCVGEGS